MLRTLLLSLLCHTTLLAQFPVGVRDVGWTNTTGQGAATLTARVHYPATVAGSNAPILARAGGWPVVVFLHGFASPGTLYSALCDAFAERGFVVVVSTTSTFDNVGQERDGRALFPAVVAANASGAFAAALDTTRIGLAGHSMGGGNVGNVLSSNPGYRCGFAIAPVQPRSGNAGRVLVPIAIVAGQGDVIAPAGLFAEPYYQSLTAVGGVCSYYLMNGDASHTNLAGLFVGGGAGSEVFARVVTQGTAFFAHEFGLSAQSMEDWIGPASRSEQRLVRLDVAVGQSQLWTDTPLAIGRSTRVSVAAEPGLAGVAAALALAPPTPTPVGDLRIEAASAFLALVGVAGAERRFDGQTAVPNDPTFLGFSLALQAFGVTTSGALGLGSAVLLTVSP